MIAKIHVNDTIVTGKNTFFGGISQQTIIDQVKPIKDLSSIEVYLNSNGGSVNEAISIVRYLQELEVPIKTIIQSVANSSASYLFLVGDVRSVYDTSKMVIHEPFIDGYSGDVDGFKRTAKDLQILSDLIANIYVESSNLTIEQVKEFMKEQKMFSAQEMLDYGFATEIINKNKRKMSNTITKKILNVFKQKDVKNLTLTSSDGDHIEVETELENYQVGDKVSKDNKELENGEYLISTGETLIVEGGVIKEIKPKEEEPEEEEPNNEVENLKKEMETLKNKLESGVGDMTNGINENFKNQSEQIKNLSERLEVTSTALDSIKNQIEKIGSPVPIDKNEDKDENKNVGILEDYKNNYKK